MKNVLVILNYNDYKTTEKLVSNIRDYSTIDDIVVVDNNSKDNSYERLLLLGDDHIHILESHDNNGYAAGNDFGCRYAIEHLHADYITIANPDVFFTNDVLHCMLEVYQTKSDAAIVGCMMKCHSKIDIQSAWKLPDYYDCILQNLMILRKIIGDRTKYSKEELHEKITPVDVIAGSFFVIPSKIYVECGGFDKKTFLYFEENILALRLKQVGKQNYLLTYVSYDHYHSISINNSIRKKNSRFKIAYTSRRYYVEQYLKKGLLHLVWLAITYKIGLFNYNVADTMRGIISNNHISRNS